MNQNQCVPNWDVDHHVGLTIKRSPPLPPSTSLASNCLSGGRDTSTSFGYEMTELAWENGKLTMLGLSQPRTPRENNLLEGVSTHKPSTRAGGTLESLVNQGTRKFSAPRSLRGVYDYHNYDTVVVPTTASIGIDGVVPSGVGCSTHVGSCSGASMRVPQCSDWSVSASKGDQMKSMATYGVTSDTSFGAPMRVPQYSDWSVSASEGDQMKSMTTYGATSDTSLGASLDNTTITLALDDLDTDPDSACYCVPQEEEDHHKKKGTTKSISSMKRSRTAATHNKSEKKRRDNISQRMKTLQNLVPNSNKTNKASMLDEAIDYMKQLQAQVQMFNTMGLPSASMILPLALQQQLHMSMMASMGMGMGFGMGMNMDQMNMSMNNAMGYPNISGLPFSVLNQTGYMSLPTPSIGVECETSRRDPLSTYLACQSHQVTMDAYSKVPPMQHFQQQGHNQGARPYR